MNIFALDKDPTKAARLLQDLHVGKMLLESCQLLCSAHPVGTAPYRRTHINHPCSIWTRASLQNYRWLIAHAEALAAEYSHRFGKEHKSALVAKWCRIHEPDLPDAELLPFALAMPEAYRGQDAVVSYRKYYAAEKRTLRGQPARWTGRATPRWFVRMSAARQSTAASAETATRPASA
jgi:hypothetical protein